MKFGNYYAVAGAMGLDPERMRQMSLWQFHQYHRGWKQFHCPPPEEKLKVSNEEWDDFQRERDAEIRAARKNPPAKS